MRYKAKIKRITKIEKPPFGDGILTWEIETTQHTGLYYTSKMSFNVGDEIEYGYIQQKNKAWKLEDPKRLGVFAYKKETKPAYQDAQEIKDNNIFYQSARNSVAQIYSGHGDNVDIEKIVKLTEYLYNKHKEFFNN
jgi:hypothetical protein